jgi:hypothetical protein
MMGDRRQRKLGGGIARRKAHRLTQLARATFQIAQLVQDQTQQIAHRRAVLAPRDGAGQHRARFQRAALIEQQPGEIQGRALHHALHHPATIAPLFACGISGFGTFAPFSPLSPDTGREFMRPIAMLGVVLIVLGLAGLFFSRVSWTETKPVAKLGPLELNSQEDHTVWIPTAAGVVAVLAGVGLVFAGKKAA